MAAPVFKFKRGPAANLGSVQLNQGEPGFTTDRYEFWIGTGTTIQTGVNTITGDPIYSPDNKFFGSANYWSRETQSTATGLNLYEAIGSGSNFISIVSPNTLDQNITYTLPGSIVDNYFLKTDPSGVLSWSNQLDDASITRLNVGIFTATGRVDFTDTTDNTLGDVDTGAVQVDGGVGIASNLTVGKSLHVEEHLNVSGVSTFVGEVTFQGGTINIGDSENDDIIVGGEFASTIGPSTAAQYDLGEATKEWRVTYTQNLRVSAGATIEGLLDLNGGIDITGNTNLDEIVVSGMATFQNGMIVDNPSDPATLYSIDAGGPVRVQNNLEVTGISTFDGNVNASSDLTVTGNLYVLGTSVEVNAETMKVEDSLIEVGLINNANLLDVPSSDLNIDVGLIMHWYDSSAKKAATFWDDSAQRIVFAKDASETNSVLTVNDYADLEMRQIWINDAVGQSSIVSVSNSERILENITIDGGSF